MKLKIFFTFLLLITGSTILLSQDYWVKTNFPDTLSVQNIFIDKHDNIFAIHVPNFVYKSTNNGYTWIYSKIDVTHINDLYFQKDTIFACCNPGIYYSTDHGNTWELFSLEDKEIKSIIFLNSGEILTSVANNNLIMRTTNRGYYWNDNLDGLDYAATINSFYNFRDSLIFATASGIVTFSNHYFVFISSDKGLSWKYYPNNGFKPYTDVKLLIENTNGDFIAGTNDGIYISSDTCNSWKKKIIIQEFPDQEFFSIAIDNQGKIFSGTQSENFGVFESTDNGETWQEHYSGLDHGKVISLVVNSKNIIYAGTTDKGIYRSAMPTDVKNDIHSNESFQIYPNPCRNFINIIFNQEINNINIYDLLGNKINSNLYQYDNNSLLNISSLEPGFYLISIQSGDNIRQGYFVKE